MASSPKDQSTPDKKKETFSKLDEAYAESSLEDQLVVYWNRHKNQIVLTISAALLIIIGFQLTKWWRGKTVADRAAAYAAASGDSQKETFADDHSGTDLGGVAYLELADEAFEAADYSNAAGYYQKALDAFEMVIFKQRAHLSLAMSRLLAGEESAAVQELESIAANTVYPEAARGEAYYQLSVIDWKRADFESMLRRHEEIDSLLNAGNWQAKARQLQNSIPELKKLVEAKSGAGISVEN